MLKVSHSGMVRFGDLACEAVVLESGDRGYIQTNVAKLLGLHKNNDVHRLRQISAEFAPKSLSLLEKVGSPILLNNGRVSMFYPAGLITTIAGNVVTAALHGTLHKARRRLAMNSLEIIRALATIGEVSLIDEATGYQYRRAPEALQELIGKLLRQESLKWEKRLFLPDYYKAIFRLFRWTFANHDRNPPAVVGQITQRWVYDQVLPPELTSCIRKRKDPSEKHHQWLNQDGLRLVERQMHAVTSIARSSRDYSDFKTRCEAAFGSGHLQLDLLVEELA